MTKIKKEILNKLKQFIKTRAKKYHFQKIGIFGSVARDEIRDDSDIDIVVFQDKPDLYLLGEIKYDLENEFKKHVDIVRYRNNMNPYLKQRIDKEAIYV